MDIFDIPGFRRVKGPVVAVDPHTKQILAEDEAKKFEDTHNQCLTATPQTMPTA